MRFLPIRLARHDAEAILIERQIRAVESRVSNTRSRTQIACPTKFGRLRFRRPSLFLYLNGIAPSLISMSEQSAAATTDVRLAAADARELAELLVFLRDWLDR